MEDVHRVCTAIFQAGDDRLRGEGIGIRIVINGDLNAASDGL